MSGQEPAPREHGSGTRRNESAPSRAKASAARTMTNADARSRCWLHGNRPFSTFSPLETSALSPSSSGTLHLTYYLQKCALYMAPDSNQLLCMISSGWSCPRSYYTPWIKGLQLPSHQTPPRWRRLPGPSMKRPKGSLLRKVRTKLNPMALQYSPTQGRSSSLPMGPLSALRTKNPRGTILPQPPIFAAQQVVSSNPSQNSPTPSATTSATSSSYGLSSPSTQPSCPSCSSTRSGTGPTSDQPSSLP